MILMMSPISLHEVLGMQIVEWQERIHTVNRGVYLNHDLQDRLSQEVWVRLFGEFVLSPAVLQG